MSRDQSLGKSFDLIVLGGGGMGSATAWEATRRGLSTLVIDRHDPPHVFGSSHGESRLIRKAYFEDPRYVPLLQRAYGLWAELEAEWGAPLLHQNGLILFGPSDSVYVRGALHAAALHGLPVQAMAADAAAAFAPEFRPAPGHVGVFEAVAGFLRVEDCVRAALTLAERRGARVLRRTEVTHVDADDAGVRVRFAGGEARARALVITAGPWSARFLTLPLVVRRVPLFWFRDEGRMAFAKGHPCFAFDRPDGFYYGMPSLGPSGVKVGRHVPLDPVADPETCDRAVPDAEAARLRSFVAHCLPSVDAWAPTASVMCLYTMSPDENFIIDRWRQAPRVAFAAGLSGHGFKFAPVVGEILVDLAVDGGTRHDVAFLGAGRFP